MFLSLFPSPHRSCRHYPLVLLQSSSQRPETAIKSLTTLFISFLELSSLFRISSCAHVLRFLTSSRPSSQLSQPLASPIVAPLNRSRSHRASHRRTVTAIVKLLLSLVVSHIRPYSLSQTPCLIAVSLAAISAIS